MLPFGMETEERSSIKFDPPVSIQRYAAVCEILSRDGQVESVADFGCSSGMFLTYVKRLGNLRRYVGVDVTYGCLEDPGQLTRPLDWDIVHKRARTLNIEFFKGNVSDRDSRLEGFDAVTCIELVEHLHEEDLRKLPDNIFGFIRPRLVVITTPNRDFNVVFPGLQGLRHWDHKFEWTRAEFDAWCSDIVQRYPGYTVEYSGVGESPSLEHRGVGYCTQIATFKRPRDDREASAEASPVDHTPYTLVTQSSLPGDAE